MNNSQDIEVPIVRQPAVAGYFYPSDPVELRKMVQQLLDNANGESVMPKALIAPHAGYIYSGTTAAIAYACLNSISDRIKRIILLGPAHRVYVRGLAISKATHFATPLGEILVDQNAIDSIIDLPQVIVSDAAHAQEHSLEVHLPFLQLILKEFTLVPLVVGDAEPQEVAEILKLLWGGDETVIIISSDLSHYHDYDTARSVDQATTQCIENLQFEKIGSRQACGCMPMRGLLQLAQELSLKVKTLDVRNSGDTAGTRDRVVGYGAWSFTVN